MLRLRVGQERVGGPLTVREVDVLRYLALGWQIPHDIATEAGLSPDTLRNHSMNLRRK